MLLYIIFMKSFTPRILHLTLSEKLVSMSPAQQYTRGKLIKFRYLGGSAIVPAVTNVIICIVGKLTCFKQSEQGNSWDAWA